MSYFTEKEYSIKKDLWYEKKIFERFFRRTDKILEIGCCVGNFVAVEPKSIVGVDIDPDAIEVCEKRGLNCKQMDCTHKFSFPDNYFDGVFACQVIEHLSDPLFFMKEIRRVLKPGGKAVIYTPDYIYTHDKFFWHDYTHKRPFTTKSLEMVAFDAGFKKFRSYNDFKQCFGMGFLIRKFNMSLRTLTKIHNFLRLNSHDIILEAIK